MNIPTRIAYDIFIDQIVFVGLDIRTGVPIEIVFNEQDQHHKGILIWNEQLKKWMHSEDAGLTWTPYTHLCEDLLNRTSLVLKWQGDGL